MAFWKEYLGRSPSRSLQGFNASFKKSGFGLSSVPLPFGLGQSNKSEGRGQMVGQVKASLDAKTGKVTSCSVFRDLGYGRAFNLKVWERPTRPSPIHNVCLPIVQTISRYFVGGEHHVECCLYAVDIPRNSFIEHLHSSPLRTVARTLACVLK